MEGSRCMHFEAGIKRGVYGGLDDQCRRKPYCRVKSIASISYLPLR